MMAEPFSAGVWCGGLYLCADGEDRGVALAYVREGIKVLLEENRWSDCDEILSMVEVDRISVDLLLALLAFTRGAKEHLPSREGLRQRASVSLRERAEALLRESE